MQGRVLPPRWRVGGLVALGLVLGLPQTPAPAAAGPDAVFVARLVAQSFFRSLLDGDIDTALPLCAAKMSFDGDRIQGPEAIKAKLEVLATRAREGGLHLKKVVVLRAPQAIKRFGPPPARIREAVRPGSMVALARFNVLGAAVVLARQDGFWRIRALTD